MRTVVLFSCILVAVSLAAGAATWSSRATAPAALKPPPAGDAAASIAPPDLMNTVIATGTLNASVTVEVGSQLSGQIASIAADFNDFVKKGQLLAQLDDAKYRADVEAAEAALESAKADERIAAARLERASIELQQIEIQRRILEAHIEKANIALDTATRELDRKTILGERNAASASDVQDSSARRDTARAALREAQLELDNNVNAAAAARSDAARVTAELERARAAVKQSEAQSRAASVDLERTAIRAPIDGVIAGRNVTQGQTLAATMEARTLFVVAADLRELDIWARIDESDISKIAVGQNARFTVDSFPGREFTAKVTQIRKAPQIVQNVVTYTVVLAARNDGYALLPGMTVVARIGAKPPAAAEERLSAVFDGGVHSGAGIR